MPGSVLRYVVAVVVILLTGTYFLRSQPTPIIRQQILPNPDLINNIPFQPLDRNPTSVPYLRILPFGDSITFGYNDPTGNSYRYLLDCLLSNSIPASQLPLSALTRSHPFHETLYTGALVHGAASWPNSRHHGLTLHGLKQLQQNLKLEIADPAKNINNPNVILLCVGTVDLIANRRIDELPILLGQLLDLIHSAWPSTVTIVGSIIPSSDAETTWRTREYNAVIPDVVRSKMFTGQKVLFTSMEAVRDSEVIDGVHPNGTAYMKMARRWYESIVAAERAGWITELDTEGIEEVKAMAEKSAASLSMCGQHVADIVAGNVEKVETVKEDENMNKNIDLYD